MKHWYGKWKYRLNDYDTIFISDGIRGRDVVQYIKKHNPAVRIIIFYINTYEYGASNDPKNYKDLDVELYTYDKEQALTAGITFKHYFYDDEEYQKLISSNENQEIWQDIFFVGEDKGRLKQIMHLHEIFSKLHLKDKLNVVASKHRKYNQEQQSMLFNRISYDEVAKNIWHSKAVLDLSWSRQHGITLRPMEAMFFKKKLITNNQDIVNYDFYDERNIFLLGRDNTKDLVRFLSDKYYPVSNEIVRQYTRDWWINSFFES